MEKLRRIREIFQSIQGEGCNTGVPSVFIRFSGCNLNCDFCDTGHESGEWMSDDDIMAEVNKYPAPQIVLTGGEPSLWIDKDFISNLKKVTGKRITIETNGTRILPEGIDWVTVSPKLFVNMKDGSTRKYDSGLKVERADELKVVDIGQDLHSYFDLPCVDAHTAMLLQPCYVENEEEREKNTRRTLRRVLDDPRWRLSLQTHRYLKIP